MFSAREGVQKKEKGSTFMKAGKTVRVVMIFEVQGGGHSV